MFFHPGKLALSCFFCFVFFLSPGQTALEVYGNIGDDNTDLVGVLIQVTQGGKVIYTTKTDPNGEYALNLPLGGDFAVEVSREGYVTKRFTINTMNITLEPEQKLKPMGASINLFRKVDGVDYSLLNQPMMKFRFNNEDQNMEFDKMHQAMMAEGIAKIREAEKEIKRQEKEREARYGQLVKDGDKSFNRKDYEASINSYQEALKLRPKEAYPLAQIENIKKLKAEADALARQEAANKARLEADAAAKKASEEAAAKAKADAEALARAQADKEKADKLAKEKADADAKAKAEAAARDKAAADALAKKQADEAAAKAKADEEARAQALAKQQADKEKADKLAKEKADADARAKAEADALAKKKADEEAATKAAEAEKQRLALEAANKAEKEKADRLAREKAEADAKAREAEETNAKLAAEQKAKAEKAEAERKKAADELAAKLKAEKDLADKKAAEKAEADARTLAEARKKAEEEELAKKKSAEEQRIRNEKLLAEAQAKEKEQARLREEADAKVRADADRMAREKVMADASRNKNDKSIPPVLGGQDDPRYKEAVRKADNFFVLKRFQDAKKAYEEALTYKGGDAYAKEKLLECEKMLQSDASQIKDERQRQLLSKYPPGITEETIPGEGVVVIRRVLVKDRVAYVYEKKLFSWGGVAFFRDGSPITEPVFEQETKK